MRLLPSLLMAFSCLQANADWQLLNSQSELSFVATKDARVADNHYFRTLNGFVKDDGYAELNIDMGSVDTNINKRDMRMRDILFRIADYPQTKVALNVRRSFVKPQPAGTNRQLEVSAKITMMGLSLPQKARLNIFHLAGGNVEVSTIEPILLDAEDYGLLPAINQLRELAGLKSLTIKVPVSFRLVFQPDQQ